MDKKVLALAQAIMACAEKGNEQDATIRGRVEKRLAALEVEQAQLQVAVKSIGKMDDPLSRLGFWAKAISSTERNLVTSVYVARKDVEKRLIQTEAIIDELKALIEEVEENGRA